MLRFVKEQAVLDDVHRGAFVVGLEPQQDFARAWTSIQRAVRAFAPTGVL